MTPDVIVSIFQTLTSPTAQESPESPQRPPQTLKYPTCDEISQDARTLKYWTYLKIDQTIN